MKIPILFFESIISKPEKEKKMLNLIIKKKKELKPKVKYDPNIQRKEF